MIEKRWKHLMTRFEFNENSAELIELKKKYNEKQRAYHNMEHVIDCLNQLDNYEEDIADRDAIELAIWYHDIIYNPYGKDNEIKSAEEASQFMTKQKASINHIEQVYQLILCTLHTKPPANEAQALIMDIDISILGSPEKQYLEYCQKIRKEYKWIPGPIYRSKRKEIMNRFLQRKCLYFTEYYYSKLEKKARINISQEIQRLS